MSNPTQLQSILKTHKFMSLLSSKELYPESKGTGLSLLKISTELMDAHISLQGAQLLHFQPKQGNHFLWLSPNCDFSAGVALRGGIPVCLPWFGPHPTDAKKPKHGFARNREWQLVSAEQLQNKAVELKFQFDHAGDELFSQAFSARLTMILGMEIQLELLVTNRSQESMDCSFAFHSYHPVKNLASTKVLGLKNREYLDNLEGHAKKFQAEDVTFPGEVDRVFPCTENSIEISGQPQLKIEHKNCPSVIVWNCGPSNAQKIADIGAGNEQKYICVERGAVLDEKWILAAKEFQTSSVKISEII